MLRRRLRLHLPALALAVGIAGVVGTARADAMRCGRDLVRDDAPLTEVLAVCGPPAAQRQRVERYARPVTGVGGRPGAVMVEVTIDELTYDFGPNEFIFELRFEDGRMVSMARNGYGQRR